MKGNYKNLFIIGNGFDRWYGLPTSYDEFKKYYRANIKKIAKKTGIQTTVNADGDLITPVELVFGDITSLQLFLMSSFGILKMQQLY